MQNFNRAFDLARSWNEVTACWSNECFEIWYLLHFHYRDTPIPRQELSRLISAETGKKYDKADAGFQKVLEPRVEMALRNARRLAFENERLHQARRNPSTPVHESCGCLDQARSSPTGQRKIHMKISDYIRKEIFLDRLQAKGCLVIYDP